SAALGRVLDAEDAGVDVGALVDGEADRAAAAGPLRVDGLDLDLVRVGQPGTLRYQAFHDLGVAQGQLACGAPHRFLREELEPGPAVFDAELDVLFQLARVEPVHHRVDYYVGELGDAVDAVEGAGK